MKPIYYILIALACICPAQLFAQHFSYELLKKLKDVSMGKAVAYDYTMYLRSNGGGIIEDSITGRFSKIENNYLDSNSSTLSVVSDGYYCKIDNDAQSATIFRLTDFYRAMGITPEQAVPSYIDVSDSLIRQFGKINYRQLADGNHFLDVKFVGQDMSRIRVEIDKNTLKIVSLDFQVDDKDKFGENTGYSTLYVMKNFSYTVEKDMLNSARFFRPGNDKIVLVGKYSKYHLNTIWNPQKQK